MIEIEYAAGASAALVDRKKIDLAISYRAVREVSPSYEVALLRGVLSPRQMMKLKHYLQEHERTFRPQDFGLPSVGDYNHVILLVEAAPANPEITTDELWLAAWKERKESIERDLKRENLVLAPNERIR